MSDKIGTVLKATGFGSGHILEALGKIAPALNPFIQGAYVAGYAADQITDFLRQQYSSPEERRRHAHLQERSAERVARPDEKAALAQAEQGQAPLTGLTQLGKFGSRAAGYLAGVKAEEAAAAQKEAASQQQNQQKEALEAYQRERQEEIDRERRTKQQHEQSSRVKKETMAAERHRMQMEKGKTKLATAPKAPPLSKASRLGKPPEDFIDALRQMDELINRFP